MKLLLCFKLIYNFNISGNISIDFFIFRIVWDGWRILYENITGRVKEILSGKVEGISILVGFREVSVIVVVVCE